MYGGYIINGCFGLFNSLRIKYDVWIWVVICSFAHNSDISVLRRNDVYKHHTNSRVNAQQTVHSSSEGMGIYVAVSKSGI